MRKTTWCHYQTKRISHIIIKHFTTYAKSSLITFNILEPDDVNDGDDINTGNTDQKRNLMIQIVDNNDDDEDDDYDGDTSNSGNSGNSGKKRI